MATTTAARSSGAAINAAPLALHAMRVNRAVKRVYSSLIQWGLRRLYYEFAWSYDLVAALVSHGYWPWWINAVIPLLAPGPTLELGCGTGYLQRALALRQLPQVGLDQSASMLRWTQHKAQVSGRLVPLVRGDATSLPLCANAFRNVVATFPAPYILAERTLWEVKRVLQPEGQFLILDNGVLPHHDAYGAASDLAYRATLQTGQNDPRPALLSANGFVVTEQWLPVGQSHIWLLHATLS